MLIPFIASLAGTALDKILTLISNKISGKGVVVDTTLFTADAQKRAFLKHVLH